MNPSRKRPMSSELVAHTRIPKFFKVRQNFVSHSIDPLTIPSLVRKVISEEGIGNRILPGMKIAITVGSRGIHNLPIIVKSIVGEVLARGASPFIVPAMGSHGCATAVGQRKLLEGYGITEAYLGCPIHSSMEVVCIGSTDDGRDVFIDKMANSADGIILFNRIKPHTAFRWAYESGIMKMMAIGLGNQHGAEACHAQGFGTLGKSVELFGRTVLKHAPILFAVPVIENAFDETERILAIPAESIIEEEPKLLREAYGLMARLFEDSCDVLLVDRIGKNYSGDGMDPNITGTFSTPYAQGGIQAQRVCVLDLSDETHGNGVGVGMANVTTQRAVDKLELDAMYANVITSTVLGGVRIPLVMESDREAIQVCIQTCTEIDKEKVRIIRIPNSRDVSHIMMSEVYYNEIASNPRYTIESEPEYLEFDEDGDLW